MDKAEWDLMGAREKDALVAEKIRGFQWRVLDITPFKSMKADLGKRFLCHPDTVRQYPKATGEEALSQEWDRFFAHYTTSYDAVVSIEEEIEKRDLVGIFLMRWLSVSGEKDVSINGRAGTMGMWRLLRTDPDTICYCVLKAVADAD